MRKPLIAGNWKMNGSLALLERFGSALSGSALSDRVDVALITPFPYLVPALQTFRDRSVGIGAQTLNPAPDGALTGEVSGPMLQDCGVRYVLAGHSERRTLFGENDQDVSMRVTAALAHGLTPILCIGETLEQRDANRVEEVVLSQVTTVFDTLEPAERHRVIIAYEPVWAIGTGRTATPEQAQAVHALIRQRLAEYDSTLATDMRLLYGGSMKPDNAGELLAQPDIDGGLIGGASLKPDDFLSICYAAG
ncbi:triose-phosphate isomerase [Kushneria phosphatilytica]|uniref:Triosephosphate isomerase n=1 Tax=Kushneria phosphatilytica TaxID=657387 RepID=A0A1S1NQY3_9GAMM|nr:triose-phosphate isomerase [Kushneria phosphatilytica]OHV11234.1 triose-phosphate isomerase [Kushneria phosphatilytica]QEL12191.1 triose-phosphate isomerase [Kushneria phosphatilytica]